MTDHIILVALDSVGIDPRGHHRPESVYARSKFLFPAQQAEPVLLLQDAPLPGVLVETDVTAGRDCGAIECALTYTSIFSGQSAVGRHGLMEGLGLKEPLLQEMIEQDNLFTHFTKPCLVNAIFPAHMAFFGGSYVEEHVPHFERSMIHEKLCYQGQPVRLTGKDKFGFPELFTAAEINQNIFVFAAQQADVRLRTWHDIRQGQALTASMTHELENDFDCTFFDQKPLPRHTPESAADVLVTLARQHDFTFYKYQMADLVSHTGRIDEARQVFATIERFVAAVLERIDSEKTVVIITSDHGHLEQLDSSRMHPKSKVPTWYFGPDLESVVDELKTPEGIFHCVVRGQPTTHKGQAVVVAAFAKTREDAPRRGHPPSGEGGYDRLVFLFFKLFVQLLQCGLQFRVAD